MVPIRQTQSYLRSLFAQRGISPQRRLGQNFLIDLNIHDLIVNAADVGSNDVILEVGSGTGALSTLMAGRGAAVVAVDVDPAMAKLLDNVRAGLAAGSAKRLKVVANLPYHVATPVIVNLLVHPELCPTLMVVTIQRELAERMCAAAATSAYGAVSVVVQALADVSIVRTLPPSVFWPRPKVDSAVVALRPDPAKRAIVADVAWFHDIVRRVFLHRRKYIRHVLAGMWSDRWTKAEVDVWLEEQGLSGQLRAEALDVDEFLTLAEALRERWADTPGDGPAGASEGEEEE
jgi:16S rRNA (adenine1518-N6/adenine1519-N6)-dimethyltransferase